MKNDLKFRIKTIKNNNNTPRKFTNNSGQKIFLSSSLKRKKMFENKSNSRYNNIRDNNNSSMVESKKNNVQILTPRYDEMIGMSKLLFQNFNKHKNNRKHLYLSNEKSLIINNNCNDVSNNNLSEYNSIISLLDNIISKYNSYAYEILIKIKNYIKKLISEKNEINVINNSYKSLVHVNDKKITLLDKSNVRIINRSEINNNKNRNKEEEINQYKLENNNLYRKIRKLYQKINELEKKYKIEKLKYLFFIIEQEKKIAVLEKKFDVKKIPLDEAIIGEMKELKCYPNYYKPDININEDAIINNSYNKNKKHPLSSTIRNIKNNYSFLKSRNNNIKNKYSFDKEVYPTPKNNQSQIIANLKNIHNKKKNNKNNSKSKNKSLRKAIKLEDISDRNDIPKNINEYSSNVNQFFCEKNFFISHPKLNYVKNSQEKNHFQKLKTKEQLNGISNISNLLSNINLNSKYQKCAVNDFSNFINNSFVNIEKYRNYHNYMNMENKFEEDLKLKRKVSL